MCVCVCVALPQLGPGSWLCGASSQRGAFGAGLGAGSLAQSGWRPARDPDPSEGRVQGTGSILYICFHHSTNDSVHLCEQCHDSDLCCTGFSATTTYRTRYQTYSLELLLLLMCRTSYYVE